MSYVRRSSCLALALLIGSSAWARDGEIETLPAKQSCILAVTKRLTAVSPDEAEAIRQDARQLADQLIIASKDPFLKVDIRKMDEDFSREVESIFGSYDNNKLLDISLKELSDDQTNHGSADSLSDVMNMLSDMNAASKYGWQGIRVVRNIPLIGERIGGFVVKQTADRMQKAVDGIKIMVQALDDRRQALVEANVETEKEIERNENGIDQVERGLIKVRAIFEELEAASQQPQTDTSKRNLDKFMRILADRIDRFQQLEMLAESMVAVLNQKIEHNEAGISHNLKVKTVSIPLTVAGTIAHASTVRLDQSMAVGDAIEKFNRQQLQKIGTDLTRQGTALRQAEMSGLDKVQDVHTLLTAVTEERRAQIAHDQAYTSNIKKIIAANDQAIARARVLQLEMAEAEPQTLLLEQRQMSADIGMVKQLGHASLDLPVVQQGN